MSIVKVDCKEIQGSVEPPYSKSYLHRFLICSYLSGEMNRAQEIINARIPANQISDDILATVDCLIALDEGRTVDCRESGTTLRMLLPIAATMNGELVFHRGPSLSTRPIQPLIAELNRHGATITEDGPDIRVKGGLEAGAYALPGNISSQFVSGLLYALSTLKQNSTIDIVGDMQSGPYVDMTIEAMESFGMVIRRRDNSFEIQGGRKYRHSEDSPKWLERDWSAAAIWYVADYLAGGTIQISGMNPESKQGDKVIIQILQLIEDVVETEDKASVLDLSDFPDIAPFVALAAVKSECKLKIVNVGRLRLKECDRLRATVDILTQLGADVTAGDDRIEIKGKQVSLNENIFGDADRIESLLQTSTEAGDTGFLLPGSDEPIETYGDHRMVMLAAIASIICEKPVIIKAVETVAKSYPDFFNDVKNLGGTVQVMSHGDGSFVPF